MNLPRPGVASCLPNWGTKGRPRDKRACNWDLIPPRAHVRHRPDPVGFWIGRHAADRGFSMRSVNELAGSFEAAHVLSQRLTEPMRIWEGCPRLAPLSMRRRSPSEICYLRGRARRLAWPACGTERFLGRDLRYGRRRRLGTTGGRTPYSCLVPPRIDTSVSHQRRDTASRTIPVQAETDYRQGCSTERLI